MKDCEWPFCHIKGCPSCARWEQKYGENIDHYLEALADAREAAKTARKGGKET